MLQKPGKAPARPQAPAKAFLGGKQILKVVLTGLDDMKAEDIVTIDLEGKTSIGDFMVVATGRSSRHVSSIADSVTKALGEAGLKGVRVEGARQSDWVLIDAGDVIVHVFRPEVRDFYGIEKMWSGSGARPRAS